MKAIFFSITVSAAAFCGSGAVAQEDTEFQRIIVDAQEFGYLASGRVWKFADGEEKRIFVCWENPSEDVATEMGWVKESIEGSWSKHTPLTFRGWKACAANNQGIRILVKDDKDDGPHTKGLGNALDAKKNGMVLNFTFQNWAKSFAAKREFYIRSIAVHEFGHAIGLAHEHNRADTPGECTRATQGTNGDMLLTEYDPQSVMNYCNEKYANNGQLSSKDIAGIQQVYGAR